MIMEYENVDMSQPYASISHGHSPGGRIDSPTILQEALKHSHKFCTPQRSRLQDLGSFAQSQRLARKQVCLPQPQFAFSMT